MGHDKDERSGALDSVDEAGVRVDIVAQGNVGQVLDVDVGLVDDLGKLAAVDLCMVSTTLVSCFLASGRSWSDR